MRDGFKLALEQEGGKLGGTPVELLVEDDARKSGKALQVANRFMKRDKVDIMTGIIWSNLAIAVVPKVVEAGVFYISPNAGPSKLAGARVAIRTTSTWRGRTTTCTRPWGST